MRAVARPRARRGAQEPEVLDDRVPLPYEVLQHHKRAYFLEVEGDCMSRVYPELCRMLDRLIGVFAL